MRCIPYALIFATCLHAFRAHAGLLLVETSARSAAGDTVGATLQVVDPDSETAVSNITSLPGPISNPSSIFRTPDGTFALTTSSDARNAPGGRSHFRMFTLPGLRPLPRVDMLSLPNWQYVGAAVGHDPIANTPLLATLALVPINEIAIGGHLDIFRWRADAPRPLTLLSPLRLLPGPPVDWVTLADGHTLAVLCRHPTRPRAIVHSLDLATEQVASMASLELGESQFGSSPSDLALSRNGRYLFALTSGYSLHDPGGEPTSWLHTLDARTLRPVAPALAVAGTSRPGARALVPAGAASCWVGTHAPGTDFAYATRVDAWESGAEIAAHVSLTGALSTPLIAPDPGGRAIAVGVGRRVEIWDAGVSDRETAAYAGGISAIFWGETGLYLGEGARVHRVDRQSGASETFVQLQSGFVTDIHALDGIHVPRTNGAPQKPAAHLPKTVTFHGEAVGHEIRSIRIGDNADSRWRIEYDNDAMPWLRVFPTEGAGPGRITMGIDPVQYLSAGGQGVVGSVDVYADAATDAARIYIQVAPDRNALRRILWIAPETKDMPEFRALMDLLSGPPLRFSHRVVDGAAPEDLDQFVAVVLGAEVAVRGALTRQALLDYVAGGGALLIVGSHDVADPAGAFRRWLEPLGIRLDTSSPVSGVFTETSSHELCRNWEGFSIRSACRIQVSPPAVSLVADAADPETSVFAQSGYGLGRVVVLGAATPLENGALATTANARFATDVFRWLARARTEVEDQDGDGLRDDIEDANGNGVRDPGETDYLAADTDGDGVPDRFEDANRNGAIDESETSPLNPDSDGDGIFDGADEFPLPPIDAPVVASVEPDTGPAEGGTFVVVHGRNFSAETAVWFGDRRSERVRVVGSTQLVAQTPAHVAERGGVPVRAVNASTALQGSLPDGYRYTPRSAVGVGISATDPVLVAFNPDEPDSQIYEGDVAFTLEVPDVALGHMSIVVRAQPADAFNVIYFNPASRSAGGHQSLRGTRLSEDLLQIDLPPWALIDAGTAIGNIHWQSRRGTAARDLVFSVVETSFTSGTGVPLQSATHPDPLRVRVPDAPR